MVRVAHFPCSCKMNVVRVADFPCPCKIKVSYSWLSQATLVTHTTKPEYIIFEIVGPSPGCGESIARIVVHISKKICSGFCAVGVGVGVGP